MSNRSEEIAKALKKLREEQKIIGELLNSYKTDFNTACDDNEVTAKEFNKIMAGEFKEPTKKWLVSASSYRSHFNDGDIDDGPEFDETYYKGHGDKDSIVLLVSGDSAPITMILTEIYLRHCIGFDKSYNTYLGFNVDRLSINNIKLIGEVPSDTTCKSNAIKALKVPSSAMGLLNLDSSKTIQLTCKQMFDKITKTNSGKQYITSALKIKDFDPFDFEDEYMATGAWDPTKGTLKQKVLEEFKKAGLEGEIIYRSEASLLYKDFKTNMKKIIDSCKAFRKIPVSDILEYKAAYRSYLGSCLPTDGYPIYIYRAPIMEYKGSYLKIISNDYSSDSKNYIDNTNCWNFYSIMKTDKAPEHFVENYKDYDKMLVPTCKNTFLLKDNYYEGWRGCAPSKVLRPINEVVNWFNINGDLTYSDLRSFKNIAGGYSKDNYKLESHIHNKEYIYTITANFDLESIKYKCHFEVPYDNDIIKWVIDHNLHVIGNEKYSINGQTAKMGRLVLAKNKPGKKYTLDKDYIDIELPAEYKLPVANFDINKKD